MKNLRALASSGGGESLEDFYDVKIDAEPKYSHPFIESFHFKRLRFNASVVVFFVAFILLLRMVVKARTKRRKDLGSLGKEVSGVSGE